MRKSVIELGFSVKCEKSYAAIIKFEFEGEISPWIICTSDSYFDLAAGEEKDIKITIHIPRDAAKGLHNGELLIKGRNTNIIKIPIMLEVI